jgi:hypothetical protein
MEDADRHDRPNSEWSLEDQFKVVYSETAESQPQQYGEESIDAEEIVEFEGDKTEKSQPFPDNQVAHSHRHRHRRGRHYGDATPEQPVPSSFDLAMDLDYTPCGSGDFADSRDIKIRWLLKQQARQSSATELEALKQQIEEELNHRATADLFADAILMKLTKSAREKERLKRAHHVPQDFECLKSAVSVVESFCGDFDDYSLKYVYQLANLCEEGYDVDEIAGAALEVCGYLEL